MNIVSTDRQQMNILSINRIVYYLTAIENHQSARVSYTIFCNAVQKVSILRTK